MIDVKTPGSPGWWLDKCYRKLNANRARLDRLDAYRRGDPPMPKRSEIEREAFRAFMKTARLNIAETLVSSISERMRPRAIRTAAATTAAGDDVAWRLFRLNELHVDFPDLVDTCLGLADAYFMIGVDPDLDVDAVPGPKDVWITAEDPRLVVTIHDPVRQSVLRAAAKFYYDPDDGDGGMDRAVLLLPGRVLRAYRPNHRAPGARRVTFAAGSWEWEADAVEDGVPVLTVDEDGQPVGIPLPEGMEDVVGVVRVRNRHGVAEFEPYIDTLDRINHMILQRMVIVTMQAFRQRAVKGELPSTYPLDHPVEALRGKPIDWDQVFTSSPDAIWLIPGAVDLWESAQADVQGVLTAVNDDLKHLAAASRRPFWIFAPDNQSATGADAANDGLVFAAEDRAVRFGAALARVMAIAFRYLEMPERAELDRIEVDWLPFERYGLGTKANAAAQAKGAGMSATWILEHVWQATPEQVRVEEQNVASDLLAARLLFGTASPPPAAEGEAAAGEAA